jgi:hypothetical protein
VLFFAGDSHASAQRFDVLGIATTHEIGKLTREFLVSDFVDSLNAGCAALSNVCEQAGTIRALCPVEDSAATAANRIDLKQRV